MGVSERTNVIIVGAGASKEFGLPTGKELQETIRKFAIFDHEYINNIQGDQLLKSCFGHDKNMYAASQTIAENMPLAPSIDNFLHTHKDNATIVEVGKLLITRSILEAEKQSTLFDDPLIRRNGIDFSRGKLKRGDNNDIPPPNYSWLGELFRLLVAEKEFPAFLAAIQNITFISFNYDRCIYQFLLYAARQYFTLSNGGLSELHEAIQVIYPYGSLGEISVGTGQITGFGRETNTADLIEISKGIRTFTEQSDHKIQNEIHEKFETCQIAIFLGFGFLPLNMEFLFADNAFKLKRVLATSYGLSDETSHLISEDLEDSLNTALGLYAGDRNDESIVEMSNMTCRELFSKHYRYLQKDQ